VPLNRESRWVAWTLAFLAAVALAVLRDRIDLLAQPLFWAAPVMLGLTSALAARSRLIGLFEVVVPLALFAFVNPEIGTIYLLSYLFISAAAGSMVDTATAGVLAFGGLYIASQQGAGQFEAGWLLALPAAFAVTWAASKSRVVVTGGGPTYAVLNWALKDPEPFRGVIWPPDVLGRALDLTINTVRQAGRATVWVAKDDELVCRANKGYRGLTNLAVPVTAGYWGRALTSKEAIEIKDPQGAGAGALKEAERKTLLASGFKEVTRVLAAPLFIEGRPYGVITADSDTGKEFSADDRSTLLFIARLTSIAYATSAQYLKSNRSTWEIVRAVVEAAESRVYYMLGHSQRVTVYSMALARKLGLDADSLQDLWYASMLHDLGKLDLPGELLEKGDRLSPEDFERMRTHPSISANIVEGVRAFKHIAPIVRAHHERYDGAGYPDKLKGDKIPVLARILAVANAFDAMSSDRPHRQALAEEEIKREFRKGAGTQFDPRVVEAMLEVLEEGKETQLMEKSAVKGMAFFPRTYDV